MSGEAGETLAPSFTAGEAVSEILATLVLPLSSASALSVTASDKMEKVMKWLGDIEEASSTPDMERRSHFGVRGAANSKIMASLLQGR